MKHKEKLLLSALFIQNLLELILYTCVWLYTGWKF